MNCRFIAVDFETYYANDYTVSDMPTQAYVMGDRFQVIGGAISVNWEYPTWHVGEAVIDRLRDLELDRTGTIVVAHNASFDGAVLEYRYGIRPWAYWCTSDGANPYMKPRTRQFRTKLSVVAELVNVGEKGGYVVKAKGKRLEDFTQSELDAYGDYCIQDAWICTKLAQEQMKAIPVVEWPLLDACVKMSVRPQVRFDGERLKVYLQQIRDEKQALLERSGVTDPALLRSNDKFAEVLRGLGIDPPTKISPTTGKETYAFAKNDPEFKALLNHENPRVQAIVAARFGHKSTLHESRTEKFLMLSKYELAGIPTRWWSAHTGREGGCLVADTYVTVLRGADVLDCRIVSVRPTDLVWDGEAFVQHDGVVFSGVREVIEYAGLIGTPDHPVLTRDGRGYVSLAEAKANGDDLVTGATPRANRIETTGRGRGYDEVACGGGEDGRGNSFYGEDNAWKAPTYDILNCGPRHRFVANGVVVHNSDGLNGKNLPKRSGDKELRRSICAPPGQKIVSCDLAQIEARMAAYVAGEQQLLDLFAAGADPYIDFASKLFGVPPEQVTKSQRTIAKSAVLGLQYGMGASKYWLYLMNTLEDTSMVEGVDTESVVRTYRSTYREIKAMWGTIQKRWIPVMMGEAQPFSTGIVRVQKDSVVLPSGMMLWYPNLRRKPDDNSFVYGYHGREMYTYGAKVFENLIQALARIVMTDAQQRIQKKLGKLPALSVYDDLAYAVREEAAMLFARMLQLEMTQPVSWAPGLPLKAEPAIGDNYGDVKEVEFR